MKFATLSLFVFMSCSSMENVEVDKSLADSPSVCRLEVDEGTLLPASDLHIPEEMGMTMKEAVRNVLKDVEVPRKEPLTGGVFDLGDAGELEINGFVLDENGNIDYERSTFQSLYLTNVSSNKEIEPPNPKTAIFLKRGIRGDGVMEYERHVGLRQEMSGPFEERHVSYHDKTEVYFSKRASTIVDQVDLRYRRTFPSDPCLIFDSSSFVYRLDGEHYEVEGEHFNFLEIECEEKAGEICRLNESWLDFGKDL